MGFQYRDAAWGLRGEIPPFELLVLMEIADRTNGTQPVERGTWPSLVMLAKALGLSRATVKRAVHRLAAAGWISIERVPLEPSVYTLTEALLGRVLQTPPRVTQTLGVGSHRPGGRVTQTPEPRKITTEENTSPPTPPRGEVIAARESWGEVCSAAAAGGNLKCPGVAKWTPVRDRQIRKLRETLDGRWGSFLEAVRRSGIEERLSPLDLSLARLTSNDCERALAVLEGRWFSRAAAARAVEEDRARREPLERDRIDRRADAALRAAGLKGIF